MAHAQECLDWIENNIGLHRSFEVLYVVDGIQCSIVDDDCKPYISARGIDINEAMEALMRIEEIGNE